MRRWISVWRRPTSLASGVIAASFAHQEGREGMDAFIEQRYPPGRSRQQP